MIPVFFHPNQLVEDTSIGSPSTIKAADFVHRAADVRGVQVTDAGVRPVMPTELTRVHSRAYVDDIFQGRVPNGFGTYDRRIPEAARWSCGSMIAAVHHVIGGGGIACSPTSGFHHAGYNRSGGFCTFNGLALAAAEVLRLDPTAVVAILDLDWHYGNGTENILANLPLLANSTLHVTSGGQRFMSSIHFFDWLIQQIDAINNYNPAVVLYQAGADMHRDDPLGGLLNDAEMWARDHVVFQDIVAPIVWNLAGGYRPETVDTHIATLRAAVRVDQMMPT